MNWFSENLHGSIPLIGILAICIFQHDGKVVRDVNENANGRFLTSLFFPLNHYLSDLSEIPKSLFRWKSFWNYWIATSKLATQIMFWNWITWWILQKIVESELLWCNTEWVLQISKFILKLRRIVWGKKLEIFEKKILSENVAQCRKM